MRSRVGPGSFLLLVVVLGSLSAQIEPGQPVEPKDIPPETKQLRLSKNERSAQVLEAIREHLPEKDWERILPALQSVIEQNDGLLSATSRAAALKVLRELPEAGREVYRLRYDPVAKDLLDRASKDRDADRLLDLLRRFEETSPAGAARQSLARLLAEQGRDAEAVAVYARLAQKPGLDSWASEDLWLALRSALRAGNESFAQKVEPRLLAAAEKGFTLGEKKWTRADVEAEIKRLRSRVLAEPPQPVATWTKPASEVPGFGAQLTTAAQNLRRQNQLVPPAGAPVRVLAKIDGKDRAALVVRSPDGVLCLNATTGDLLWRMALEQDYSTWMKDVARAGIGKQWLTSHTGDSSILFDNTRTGRLAVAGEWVTLVEDVPFLPGVNPLGGAPQIAEVMRAAVQNNRLVGIHLTTGKLTWVTDSKKTPDLAGWFLGSPLVMGEVLFVLHEQARELRLLQIEAKSGKLLQLRKLGQMDDSLGEGAARRRGLELAPANGRLIVPTGNGTLLALNLPELDLAWMVEVGEAIERPVRPFPVFQVRPATSFSYTPQTDGDLLVYTGPDTRRIHALEPATGKTRWAVASEESDRLVTLTPEGVLVVSHAGIRLLDRQTGAASWRLQVQPLGRGMIVAGNLILPVGRAGGASDLAVLDLARGKELSRAPLPDNLAGLCLFPVGAETLAIGPGGLMLLPPKRGER